MHDGGFDDEDDVAAGAGCARRADANGDGEDEIHVTVGL